jgi:hyperosmotically inducible protein
MKYLTLLFISLALLMTGPIQAAKSSNKSEGVIAYVQDAAITTAVLTKFKMHRSISDSPIDVTTNNGIASLSGTVNSLVEENELKQLASSSLGVTGVDTTHLTIQKSEHPFKDSGITTKVKALFLKDKLFGDVKVPVIDIHVETNNGIVYLSGKADNLEQIQQAIKIAQSVSDVTKVVSIVEVDRK